MRYAPVSVLSVAIVLTQSCLGADTPGSNASAAQVTVLDDQASQLRADFNRNAGSVRLLLVVDPVCPTCLRGLDDMDRDLLKATADSRLHTFVVYEPVLGTPRAQPWSTHAEPKDVSKAAELLHNAQVQNYWNASGAFGELLSRAVGLKNDHGPVYAWDVWLLYGPEATWEGSNPPRPRLLMNQLGSLHGSTQFPHLDTHAFAQQAQQLLAQLPPDKSPAAAHSP